MLKKITICSVAMALAACTGTGGHSTQYSVETLKQKNHHKVPHIYRHFEATRYSKDKSRYYSGYRYFSYDPKADNPTHVYGDFEKHRYTPGSANHPYYYYQTYDPRADNPFHPPRRKTTPGGNRLFDEPAFR